MHPLISRFLPLALLAGIGIVIAGWVAYTTVVPHAVPSLSTLPAQGPWRERISASGLIEGDGNDTRIGVPEAALVSEVAIRIGQQVKTGDLLFRLDDRLINSELLVARAELVAAKAGVTAAQARLDRLTALPRAEDLPPVLARMVVGEARLADAVRESKRFEKLLADKATTGLELDVRRGAENIVRAELGSSQADLAHARLSAWAPDLASAQADVSLAQARVGTAEAQVATIDARLARFSVRAPRDATVIANEVMVGALAAPGDQRLVVLADLARLMVRVEVDESQVWKLRAGVPGRAWLRGDSTNAVDLIFERIEPSAGPRRAIPGKPGERLDSRAVQVLYRIAAPPPFLRPGLLLEVDLQADAVDVSRSE